MKKLIKIILLAVTFSACKTRYIPMPYETIKTEYRDKYHRDSIYSLDSVIIREKGDTVYLEKYKYLYRDREVKDSIFVNDTIREAYPVEIVKEVNRLENWQIGLMMIGVGALVALIVVFYSKIKRWFALKR